eukprot:Nk52_evm21s150 gene=Nk52_evmTU21s150
MSSKANLKAGGNGNQTGELGSDSNRGMSESHRERLNNSSQRLEAEFTDDSDFHLDEDGAAQETVGRGSAELVTAQAALREQRSVPSAAAVSTNTVHSSSHHSHSPTPPTTATFHFSRAEDGTSIASPGHPNDHQHQRHGNHRSNQCFSGSYCNSGIPDSASAASSGTGAGDRYNSGESTSVFNQSQLRLVEPTYDRKGNIYAVDPKRPYKILGGVFLVICFGAAVGFVLMFVLL